MFIGQDSCKIQYFFVLVTEIADILSGPQPNMCMCNFYYY